MINRVDRRSQVECLKQCGELLKQGASVLFFPEGTRSKDGRMHGFKKGAFSGVHARSEAPFCSARLAVGCPRGCGPPPQPPPPPPPPAPVCRAVAAKAKVPVVPITLVGTGDLMPNAREYLLFPGKVKVCAGGAA